MQPIATGSLTEAEKEGLKHAMRETDGAGSAEIRVNLRTGKTVPYSKLDRAAAQSLRGSILRHDGDVEPLSCFGDGRGETTRL
eukprot:COSAG02_NODE_51668_length_312_cov_1.446009_1_plen_82_part_01